MNYFNLTLCNPKQQGIRNAKNIIIVKTGSCIANPITNEIKNVPIKEQIVVGRSPNFFFGININPTAKVKNKLHNTLNTMQDI